MSARAQLVDVALGRASADVVVRGGTLVNVASGELYPADVAIKGERIAAVGSVEHTLGEGTAVVEADGRFLVPGLVEGHLHQYHSYLGVNEFVEALLRHGVTATADAFYGPGIVRGAPAVRFFKEAFERMPIRLLFLVPAIAYLQNRELGLTPTPGVSSDEMHEMLDWDGCYGLEEPPPLPVMDKDPVFLDLFDAALERRKVITGHAAGLDERQVQAYAAAGAYTDHEMVTADEARIRARAGMKLLARHGSGCPDLPRVIRAHTEMGVDPHAFGFCTDLASPEKLVAEGTIDHAVRVAIASGVEPMQAIQMATLNTAEVFIAQQDIGSIAPGRYADLLLVDRLADLSIHAVLVGGRTVVRDGRLVVDLPPTDYPPDFHGTVTLARPVTVDDLTFRVNSPEREAEVRVVGVNEGSLETDERRATLPVTDGSLRADVDHDVLHLAMIDRHGKGTGTGLGFVQGFGLRHGAFASTANSQCENIVIVGTNPADMAVAANHVAGTGGGKVVVDGGRVTASVDLPILGLHTDEPLDQVMRRFDEAFAGIAALGCELDNPYSQLEFCFACGEIGDIKLSEEGLLLLDPPRMVPVLL